MKRLIAVLSGLLVLPAFAEVAPTYLYEDVTEFIAAEIAPDDATDVVADEESATPDAVVNTPVRANTVTQRNVSGRTTASRATASNNRVSSSPRNSATNSRAVAARTATTTATTSRGTAARATRTANAASRATGTTTQSVSARRNVPSTNTARASIVQTDTTSTPLYYSRVGVRGSSSAATTRSPTVRVSSASTTTTSIADTASDLDELAQITDFCKAQYTACMDNFCNVLDDNQGRCSCSANLKNYAKTEEALKQATADLQDVAQKIQYIGLSSSEVETLFTQTEAELEMQTNSDNTQLKNDLDKIKDLIIDVKTGTATSTASSGMSIDLSGLLDFSIDSTGFDLSGLFGTTSTNTSSISNQRGEQLYKTAAARCKASVLNSCTAQGVDASIITNAYDLEIDKQCIVYERNLTDSNDQMTSTVRNAKSVLQKARLMVAQQKNSYDLRGCVNALDSCMQDDFVCGSDYENCLDPTGRYLVNGTVVVGSKPGAASDPDAALYETWDYDSNKNAWSTGGTLGEYIEKTVTATAARNTSAIMSEFLQNKIGYAADGKNYGMCMSVMNKCQDITYNGTGQKATYNPQNAVVKEYLQRTLVQIKAQQDDILASYAEKCISDVSSCLSQNNYDATKIATDANNKLAANACLSMINTCISVNGISGTPETSNLTVTEWLNSIMGYASDTDSSSSSSSSNTNSTGSSGTTQTQTCPSNSTGTYPNCTCARPYEYSSTANTCKAPACTTENGTGGTYPSCGCNLNYQYNSATNKCEPTSDGGDQVVSPM